MILFTELGSDLYFVQKDSDQSKLHIRYNEWNFIRIEFLALFTHFC